MFEAAEASAKQTLGRMTRGICWTCESSACESHFGEHSIWLGGTGFYLFQLGIEKHERHFWITCYKIHHISQQGVLVMQGSTFV